ncbi:MAG: 1-acyl-sn-glycerol-3-phosphate acyltransferase [Rhodobacteraceae bacterium HLUCCO07]|nr:MAG: 1-acyl-sn-glycerol-3-phosphate acyltransferase [Rhodobacteraceae bacterium HLUCCO07]
MTPWDPSREPPQARIGPAGMILVLIRGGLLSGLIFGGLGLLLLLRLIERPLNGMHRPWTPWIVQAVSAIALNLLGIRYQAVGKPMRERGAVVSNHSSWLDIFVLNARKRVYFVSKAEVARWPAIGWLARAVGTVFINRDSRQAKAQQALFEDRLLAGHRLLFFPEGTSTDGMQVLPFKSTLFEAFFSLGEAHALHVQPVTLIYRAPRGQDPRFYGWWGDMAFGPHLARVMSVARPGAVTVIYHNPLNVNDFPNRKALAKACEAAVRSGLHHSQVGA